MSQPFYEPFIARNFPGWAARRSEARCRNAMFEASYRGAIDTRLSRTRGSSTGWGLNRRGGTAADRVDLRRMRDRAREVYRDNPIGRSILDTEVTNVVADGYAIRCQTTEPEFNKEAQERWYEWLEVADIRGLMCASQLQRMFYRSPRRDGDGGIVLVDLGGRSRLQYIPGDLIVTPPERAGDFNSVIDGVEVDRAGRPIAFHVLDEDQTGKQTYARVLASNFIYLTPSIDDLAIRGESCYAQVFDYLDQLGGYVDAVVIAARMAAIFGLIFKEDSPAKSYSGLPTLTNSQGNQQRAVTLEQGMLKYMGTGSDVVQVQAQQPMQQTPDFIRAMMRLIGMPFDMPLEVVYKDSSQGNFSNTRLAINAYYRAARARQSGFTARCMSRIYQWWIGREVKLGNIVSRVPERYWPHVFRPVAWPYMEPIADAQADLLRIDMGVKAPQMVVEETVSEYNWEEIQIQLAAARAERALKQLPEIHSTYTRDPVNIPGAKDVTNG